MTRLLATLALTLALAASAAAQEGSPKQTPKHEPALDLIGAALLEADKNQVLQARLLDEQIFKAVDTRKGPLQALLRVRGQKSAKGISLEIHVTLSGMGERTVRYFSRPPGPITHIIKEASTASMLKRSCSTHERTTHPNPPTLLVKRVSTT